MRTSGRKFSVFLSLVFFTILTTAQDVTEFRELQSVRRMYQLSDYREQVIRLDSLTFMDDLEAIRSMAHDDIHRGKAFLLLASGIAPNINSTDINFENKYDVYYYDYGCLSPSSATIEAYNEVIFCHLTNKYGNNWIAEIRRDVSCVQHWEIRE